MSVSATAGPPATPPPAAPRDPPLRRVVRDVFGLDLRSLALLRIGLALVILWDLQDRARDLSAHYTADGALPGRAIPYDQEAPFSLHLIHDSFAFQACLFGLSALCAVGLLVGWQTRLMTLLCWVMTLSVQGRSEPMLHGGDVWMRVILFWCLFLPTGAVWSADAARSRRPPPPSPLLLSLGTAALVIQMGLIYVFSALWKHDPAWHGDATAVGDALALEAYMTPLGQWLRGFPGLLRLLTYFTFYLEAFGPALLFVPVWTQAFRLVAVALFVGLHVGLGLTLELGNFALVCTVTWLGLLPPLFWDRAAALGRVFRGARWPAPAADARPLPPLSATANFLVGFNLLFAAFWNASGLDNKEYPAAARLRRYRPASWHHFAAALGLNQGWGVFAPRPGTYHGWFVMPARLRDGSEVDLFRRCPVDWARPAMPSEWYVNSRWRRYLLNLLDDDYAWLKPHFAEFLRRRWDRDNPGREVMSLEVYLVRPLPEPREDGSTEARDRVFSHTFPPEGDPP
jgi:hypothetical protein